MPRRLILAPRARDDIEAARRWLMQLGSGPAAWHKLDAILAAIEDLRDHPCRFPVGSHPGVRERLCAGGWRALYAVGARCIRSGLTPDATRPPATCWC